MADIPTWISQAAQKYNLDPAKLTAQLAYESGLDPSKVNPKSGAAGIAQFMPGTARGFGIDPMNPQQAIFAAAAYMRQNLNRFNNDYPTALAAYNWGPGNVAKYGLQAAPPETQRYVANLATKGQAATPVGGTTPTPAPAADTQVQPQTLSPETQRALQTDRLQPAPDVPPPPGMEGDENSLSSVLLNMGKRIKQQNNLV
jgi:soluble lytic murein transglycosylase-like protein